jgi:bacillithiol system protein YtxJ
LDNIYIIEVLESPELKYYIADKVGIKHESPQILIFKNGKLSTFANHNTITKSWIEKNI